MNSTFRDIVIRELGLDGIPAERQEEALMRAGQLIFQTVLLRVVDALPDEKKSEFESLMQNPANAEALFDFVRANVPEFDDIVRQEVLRFKEESAAVMQSLQI